MKDHARIIADVFEAPTFGRDQSVGRAVVGETELVQCRLLDVRVDAFADTGDTTRVNYYSLHD